MSQPNPRPPRARPRRPQRSDRKRVGKRGVVFLAIGAALLVTIISCAAGNDNSGNQKSSAASSAAARAALLADARKSAERACGERPPASRDIYVRIVKPGKSPEAQRLSGKWRWDRITGKCLTAVHFMTATAPRSAGHCTQVGYVTDNPGYRPDATPAPPLPHIAATGGPACAAAAASPPTTAPPSPTTAPPTTAPPPAPPTATPTPTGCYPISNEGTCYEPGEYCRDDDHGASGVAGDGEAIICEYNDGWRWEPA